MGQAPKAIIRGCRQVFFGREGSKGSDDMRVAVLSTGDQQPRACGREHFRERGRSQGLRHDVGRLQAQAVGYMVFGKSDFAIHTCEASNDRGGKGGAERSETLMKKMEPHTEVGNSTEHSDSRRFDPASKRALIAAKARSNLKERFNNLLHHLTYELVEECLLKISLSSAPGVDGVTAQQARDNLNWILPPLLKQIHEGKYQAPPVRRVYIPKADGKQRPLGVPEIIDRAIQAAMTKILNEIYEQDFLVYSFGFRPKIGCHHALATIGRLSGLHHMNHVLEVDIRDFFGSLSHDWLNKFLELRIGDQRVLALINAWLKAGVMEDGKMQRSDIGTPQGGSISPLLANVYLHYVLDLWFDKKIKPKFKKKSHLVRYADDFVVMFQDAEEALAFQPVLRTRLAQFGLTLAEDKTHTTSLKPDDSGKGNRRRRLNFLGFNIFLMRNRQGWGWKVVYRTDGKRLSRAKAKMKDKLYKIMHRDIKQQVVMINAILRGHFNYYGMPGNTRKLSVFWNLTMRYWRRRLTRRSQKGAVSWSEITELRKKYPWVLPRLKIRYADLETYVRL